MRGAVILLWAGCLYAIAQAVLWFFWAASPLRQMLTLAVLTLALSSCHRPGELSKTDE